ncbi:MAG TPA: hypothetical protein VEL31_27905 [Ktedonobacteraceae bacterium]|nr:hypothetical protein [Ktedonobacteraceae bacterium]
MGLTLSVQTRQELLVQIVPRYREALASQKGALLPEIAATTGYALRYVYGSLCQGRCNHGSSHGKQYTHPVGVRSSIASLQSGPGILDSCWRKWRNETGRTHLNGSSCP